MSRFSSPVIRLGLEGIRYPLPNTPDASASADHPAASFPFGVRTILVPADIVGVQRRAPVRVKGRTPWQARREADGETERAGNRSWFSDQLFVDAPLDHPRTGFGTSLTVHLGVGLALVAFVLTHPDAIAPTEPKATLTMPALIAPVPVMDKSVGTVARAAPKQAALPPPPARSAEPATPLSQPAAPIESPPEVLPETGAEGSTGGVVGGVDGGVEGGIAGGLLGGTSDRSGGIATSGPASGPVQAGRDVKPPRKIRDARPIYPQAALDARTWGVVIIEIIIGTDGKVQDSTVLRSIPLLDAAAVNAVRQWEFTPTLLNGLPVPVVMTVTVNFSIQ
jgi:periplasmic protein TonB